MAKAKQSLDPKSSERNEPSGQRQQVLTRREPHYPALWSNNPFAMMNRFAEEMERMFDDFGIGRSLPTMRFGRGWGELESSQMVGWSPQIEVFEREGQFIVRADLPGLKKDDVKVDITDDALTIQGERKQEHEEEGEGWYRSERGYGSFFRSIPLPEGINADEAKASFRDGVLEISMPAPQQPQQRRRQIEVS
ncbi:MAG: Hsp20/alpha crystallin family protein [Acidobacteriota bacterium]